MWLMTDVGYFSIAQAPFDPAATGTLTVRSRSRPDLDAFRERYCPTLGPVRLPDGDEFPYAAVAPRAHVAEAVAKAAAAVDYGHFEDVVQARGRAARSALYRRLSTQLRAIEQEPDAGSTPTAPDAWGGVVVNQHGGVLLRKPADHFDGYAWTFPKGRPSAVEEPESCAYRNVEATTGYRARAVARIPGDFRSDRSSAGYFLMARISDGPQEGATADVHTSATCWSTWEGAEELLRETTNEAGRARDLAVLAAARRTWEHNFAATLPFPTEPIGHGELRPFHVPGPDADWATIAAFALTYPGYQVHGMNDCAAIANARRPSSLDELRTCLFFEQRRYRHFGDEPEGRDLGYLRAVVAAIKAMVVARSFVAEPTE